MGIWLPLDLLQSGATGDAGLLVAELSYPAQNWLPSDAGKPEWITLDTTHFNLKLNKSVLTKQFQEEIQRVRSEPV